MRFLKLRLFLSNYPSWSHLRFPRAIFNYNLSKIIMHLLFTIKILCIHVLKIFLPAYILDDYLVSRTPDSHFKTWITLSKFANIKNGSRVPQMGPGGEVWWEKKQLQKSHATVTLTSGNNNNNNKFIAT